VDSNINSNHKTSNVALINPFGPSKTDISEPITHSQLDAHSSRGRLDSVVLRKQQQQQQQQQQLLQSHDEQDDVSNKFTKSRSFDRSVRSHKERSTSRRKNNSIKGSGGSSADSSNATASTHKGRLQTANTLEILVQSKQVHDHLKVHSNGPLANATRNRIKRKDAEDDELEPEQYPQRSTWHHTPSPSLSGHEWDKIVPSAPIQVVDAEAVTDMPFKAVTASERRYLVAPTLPQTPLSHLKLKEHTESASPPQSPSNAAHANRASGMKHSSRAHVASLSGHVSQGNAKEAPNSNLGLHRRNNSQSQRNQVPTDATMQSKRSSSSSSKINVNSAISYNHNNKNYRKSNNSDNLSNNRSASKAKRHHDSIAQESKSGQHTRSSSTSKFNDHNKKFNYQGRGIISHDTKYSPHSSKASTSSSAGRRHAEEDSHDEHAHDDHDDDQDFDDRTHTDVDELNDGDGSEDNDEINEEDEEGVPESDPEMEEYRDMNEQEKLEARKYEVSVAESVGIEQKKEMREMLFGQDGGILSDDGGCTYYIGIIDFLSEYDGGKQFNHCCVPSMCCIPSSEVSAVPVPEYGQRFHEFMKRAIK
jgi:hypothetical protein